VSLAINVRAAGMPARVTCWSGDTRICSSTAATSCCATSSPATVSTARDRPQRPPLRPTTVEAHWQTSKPGYRLDLADGTTLTASADHRFLTDAGWGLRQRPAPRSRYLAAGDELHGVWSAKVAIRSITRSTHAADV